MHDQIRRINLALRAIEAGHEDLARRLLRVTADRFRAEGR